MKAKALLLTLFLSVVAVSLWAQEKYELAIVRVESVGTNKYDIVVTTSSGVKTYEVEKNSNPTVEQLKQIESLIAQGWETVTINHASYGFSIYHLQRKKN